jgi:hypothetical protein
MNGAARGINGSFKDRRGSTFGTSTRRRMLAKGTTSATSFPTDVTRALTLLRTSLTAGRAALASDVVC